MSNASLIRDLFQISSASKWAIKDDASPCDTFLQSFLPQEAGDREHRYF